MRPTLLSPKRRAIVRGLALSAVVAPTAGVLVACQGDEPVAPNRGAVAADTAASKYLYRPGLASLTWQATTLSVKRRRRTDTTYQARMAAAIRTSRA